ncbi:MAG TPA: MBL fold metallo-hydrolase [Syntrophales bacterium]|jgi:hydroxyacylglutathione hydrolase|nr:MBL fold metallo-hydrolase [Syntrophales bacterium]HPX54985.1 MBL fold metallo-hydrolase [Syntrophales bacterium]HQA83222.1 MBL fold metallo-hydrolase [Syntrophales bacterium]
MLYVAQFRYSADNLAYLVYGRESAAAIDGGAVDEIALFLEKQHLRLRYVVNTHHHYDHTSGNDSLLSRYQARFVSCRDLSLQGRLVLENETIRIYPTPGHTDDSLCFHVDNILITGDTLFNGTIGNCFSGRIDLFYQSIKKIMTLPKETVIYAGHDYIRDSIFFARQLEPDNADLNRFLADYDPDHVYSTLADEFRINPYLRFNDAKMVDILQNEGLATGTEWQRWESLMSL